MAFYGTFDNRIIFVIGTMWYVNMMLYPKDSVKRVDSIMTLVFALNTLDG